MAGARLDIRKDMVERFRDLRKFGDSFKLNSPMPPEIISIIAKDPTKQKVNQ
jgi:hypothetical protein